jgi:hypothetical protein
MEKHVMDGESFDRLSVVVHRLRNTATRRRALGLLLSGSVAAVSGMLADDAGARDRNRNNNCRRLGRSCSSNRDCCSSDCRHGRCWTGSGGGGGGSGQKRCGGQNCQSGWRCCSSRGVSVCVPRNYPVCCGKQSFVNGYQCCGGSVGACREVNSCTGQFGICCQSGWKYCNSGFYKGQCLPKDWSCNDLSQSSQADNSAAESTETAPTSPPVEISPDDWIDLQK